MANPVRNSPPAEAGPVRGPVWWRSAWVVVPAIALLGLVVLQNGFVRTNKLLAPELAVAIGSGDARANAAMASALLNPNSADADKTRALVYVKSALRQDPTNAEAIRDAGLIADIVGDANRARNTMLFGQALSRRDVPTQLWLLEDADNRGDVQTSLDHFDIALRTSNAVSTVLVPILVRAIGEPPLARAIVNVLMRRPAWAEGYLITVAQTGQDNTKVAELFLALMKAGVPVPQYIRDTLIRRFVDGGDFALGMKLYRAFVGTQDSSLIRNGGFEQSDSNVAFEWQPVDTPGISAQRVSENGNSVLEIQGSPGTAGPVMRQMIVLSPGRYTIEGTFRSAADAGGQTPSFDLTCAGTQPVAVGRVVMTRGQFQSVITIPATGCPAQWLTLSVPTVESSNGIAGTLDNVGAMRLQ